MSADIYPEQQLPMVSFYQEKMYKPLNLYDSGSLRDLRSNFNIEYFYFLFDIRKIPSALSLFLFFSFL